MTTHRYASWYRRGLAAARKSSAVAGANPIVAANLTIDGVARDVSVTLHGPGDVAGLGAHAIVRREPAPGAVGVGPEGLPFVELSPPDLPWRFSPGGTPAPAGALSPWLALVVVPAKEPFGPKSGAVLPVLDTTRGELPDPRDAWAWAHVQIEEPAGGLTSPQIAPYLRDHPDRAVARLVCPRKLEVKTSYRACLVPLFESGRRTGLGIAVGDAGIGFAWGATAVAATPVSLPVYDAWLIETAEPDDFEVIARRLRARDATELFAPLAVDVRLAAGHAEPVVATMFGLLRPQLGATSLPLATEIATALEPQVTTDNAAEPAIGPPLYAAAQTGRQSLAGAPAWQRELNLDPRRRAQAAAGAEIVRADQEQLVADARAAAGELSRANALVRGAQLAALVAQRLHDRHVAPRPPHRVLSTLWPVLAGTPVAATAAAPAPGAAAMLSPALRRLARPAGPLARGRVAGAMWSRLGRGLSLSVGETALAAAATPARVAVTTASATTLFVAANPARTAEIRTGLAERAARSVGVMAPALTVAPTTPADTTGLATQALAATHAIGVAKRVGARIDGVPQLTMVAQLAELKPAIDLSRPLSDRLAQLRPEMFAPGLSALPVDTVCVLTVDQAAVRAILAGANDELSRELAWRGVAIDRRTTLLRQLWTRGTRDPIAHDVPPIDQWTGALDPQAAGSEWTVFLVRSELVRRFPTAIYFCLPAIFDPAVGRKPDSSAAPLMPTVQGLATPELAYIGFQRPSAVLAGDPAWSSSLPSAPPGFYFAIQERPTHTRFGLDVPTPGRAPGTMWPDLAWSDVTASPYISLDLAKAPHGFPAHPGWRASSAAMAAITERPAVRVAFHVQELLHR
jgi:hypothetical protein